MKKLLLTVICLTSVFITSVAFASISKEFESAKYLAQKGIIALQNSQKEYRLTDTITRKEVSKIISKIAGVTPLEKCVGKFSDVSQDWGCKYIEWMLDAGYIAPNKTFRPDDTITKSEAVKLIFKARNIEKKYTTNNWQEDYAKTAAELDLVDIYTDYNSVASRGWIFRVAARGFEDYKQKEQFMSDEAL